MKFGRVELTDWIIDYDTNTNKAMGIKRCPIDENSNPYYGAVIYEIVNKEDNTIHYFPAFIFAAHGFNKLFREKHPSYETDNLEKVKKMVDDFIEQINSVKAFW